MSLLLEVILPKLEVLSTPILLPSVSMEERLLAAMALTLALMEEIAPPRLTVGIVRALTAALPSSFSALVPRSN